MKAHDRKPSRLDAQPMPNRLYIAVVNRGKIALAVDLMNSLPANTEAAQDG